VIIHEYGKEIEAAIDREAPGLEKGQRIAEYSRQYAKINKKISNDPKENARIETLQQQWLNTGPPAAVRRKYVH
jgi:hypothetical protein